MRECAKHWAMSGSLGFGCLAIGVRLLLLLGQLLLLSHELGVSVFAFLETHASVAVFVVGGLLLLDLQLLLLVLLSRQLSLIASSHLCPRISTNSFD